MKQRNQFELLDIIKSLANKSAGPVSIPIKLLELIPDLILIPLCNHEHFFYYSSFT